MSTIRHATEADLPRICRTTMLAFQDDPVMRWLFPEDADFYLGGGRQYRPWFRRFLAFGSTYTTDDAVSVAAFIPPGRPAVEVAAEPDDPVHPPDRVERFRALAGVMVAHTPPEPHWYLNVLATHPDWQRQGLGTLAIAPMIATCDAEGLPLYLETETPANVAYYSHLGFRIRAEWDIPLDGPHMWGMIRHPR